jgi:plasmid rolling circle replication initiator protein Rep
MNQTGQKLTSRYCNNRWCSTCNRIRTAKLINGYTPELAKLPSKQFVTLTVPNCKENDLFQTVEMMFYNFKRVKDRLRKKSIKLTGIRKIEITYNAAENTYHPHFHFIISGRKNSEHLVNEWLKVNPDAKDKAQDIRPADEKAIKELFKYFTKLLSKSSRNKIFISALDNIFQVMRGRRTFQAMGIKKYVSEDIEEIQSMLFEDLEEKETLWTWEYDNWYDVNGGDCLTTFVIDKQMETFFNKIIE